MRLEVIRPTDTIITNRSLKSKGVGVTDGVTVGGAIWTVPGTAVNGLPNMLNYTRKKFIKRS